MAYRIDMSDGYVVQGCDDDGETAAGSRLLELMQLMNVQNVVVIVNWLLLVSRQGKVRLTKWFVTIPPKEKAKIVKDATQLVLARRIKMCNFLEYKDQKIVYRRYASLFFVVGISQDDNELITLEILHRYVEILDRYFGNVCELDLIFNFQKAYFILDELLIAGELQETSKKSVLRVITQQDQFEDQEGNEPKTTS
ncbi:AP-1 adaptor complex sigma subunit Aps1 [Apophysomyces sp. BC1034]|nr:AP-1 adaptor complex sigma subunit Aps1 [Apophysomyces sp. BC1034]